LKPVSSASSGCGLSERTQGHGYVGGKKVGKEKFYMDEKLYELFSQ
jgi:hypothetical protein